MKTQKQKNGDEKKIFQQINWGGEFPRFFRESFTPQLMKNKIGIKTDIPPKNLRKEVKKTWLKKGKWEGKKAGLLSGPVWEKNLKVRNLGQKNPCVRHSVPQPKVVREALLLGIGVLGMLLGTGSIEGEYKNRKKSFRRGFFSSLFFSVFILKG